MIKSVPSAYFLKKSPNHEIFQIDKVFSKTTNYLKKLNQRNIGIISAIIVGVIISVIVVFTLVNEKDENVIQTGPFEGWIGSGPFKINKQQYMIGEQVFIAIDGLTVEDSGNVIFLAPNKVTYISIPFDGAKKTDFNQYFKPTTSRALKICSIDDLVGEWTVIFQGVTYERLYFEIIEEFLPGDEEHFPKVC